MINKKSFYKAISWRCLSVSVGYVLSYLFFGNAQRAGVFMAIYASVGTVLYYIHERLWAVIRRKKWLNI